MPMRNLKPGDRINVRGFVVTIFEIYAQDFHAGTWDVEFLDTCGKYRHWKSDLDGGEVIFKD